MFQKPSNIPDRTEGLGAELKSLIDAAVAKTPTYTALRVYLYAVGYAGKNPYADKAIFEHTPNGDSDYRSPLEILNRAFQGDRVMASIHRERADCIRVIGRDALGEIEKRLGIDSRGLDAQDRSAFLGMNQDLVVKAVKYLLPL